MSANQSVLVKSRTGLTFVPCLAERRGGSVSSGRMPNRQGGPAKPRHKGARSSLLPLQEGAALSLQQDQAETGGLKPDQAATGGLKPEPPRKVIENIADCAGWLNQHASSLDLGWETCTEENLSELLQISAGDAQLQALFTVRFCMFRSHVCNPIDA